MKNETFSVRGPCRCVDFLSFCNFTFSVCPGSTAIFGHKSATQPFYRNIKYGKLRNTVGSVDPNYRG